MASQVNAEQSIVESAVANGQAAVSLTTTSQGIAKSPETPGAPATEPAPQRGGFVPLDDPAFLTANETDYFGDEELVLGVEFAGEVRAYPVRTLRYHHVVNDTVEGEPLLVTY